MKKVPGFAGLLIVLACSACSDMMESYKDKDLYFFGRMKAVVPKNAVGATTSTTLRTLDFTPSNDNAVFVAKTGNDATGLGSTEHPFLTINKAITACDAGRQAVVIADSGTYAEKGFEMTGNIKKLFAAIGCNPVLNLQKNNSYFRLSEIQHETPFTGNQRSNISATTLNNGNVFVAYRDDMDSYNAKYQILDPNGWVPVTGETALPTGDILCIAAATLPNGNVFIVYNKFFVSYARFMVIDPSESTLTCKRSLCATRPIPPPWASPTTAGMRDRWTWSTGASRAA
ncbi:MAG: hypothetical protein A2176_04890 [Spirochaetes bacterium RBG_13_51_14]|nr:MAG: hypothetical protein A2176_04890 [Spirochaetes bacterium RBG_13_51_14]